MIFRPASFHQFHKTTIFDNFERAFTLGHPTYNLRPINMVRNRRKQSILKVCTLLLSLCAVDKKMSLSPYQSVKTQSLWIHHEDWTWLTPLLRLLGLWLYVRPPQLHLPSRALCVVSDPMWNLHHLCQEIYGLRAHFCPCIWLWHM